MKKRGLLCLYVVTICILGATMFAMAGSDESIVENLVCQRTDTLNAYYGGRIGKDEALEIIERIEADHQKEEDLQNIMLFFQTDIEQVEKYEIKEIDITYADEDMICACVTIDWVLQGLEGEEKMRCSYSVICKKEENMYKLAQFF